MLSRPQPSEYPSLLSADLPEYIMENDIVRAALRVAKEVDATDEEWQAFMEMLKNRQH